MSYIDFEGVTLLSEQAGKELTREAETEAILVFVGSDSGSAVDAVSNTQQGVTYGTHIEVFRVGDGYILKESDEVEYTRFYVTESDLLPVVVQEILNSDFPEGSFKSFEVDDEVWWYDEVDALS